MSDPVPREDAFESFPEPRTFPKHWDGEAMTYPTQLAASATEPPLDTFPEPNTIPGQWDVSALIEPPNRPSQ